ncbi:hypothetical protein [Catenovulum agarivorans]|uniref:hypothetical protein n=1 Tax=Catenovulum agarivorans TaxID=1172192 RepID=UPI00030798C5|nr:hypothetical protein [Catenovulum agarivorans]
MKKLKAIFIVFIGVCVGVLLYQLWPTEQASKHSPAVQQQQGGGGDVEQVQNLPKGVDSTQQKPADDKPESVADSAKLLNERKQQVALKQAEIEVLMAELDENLSDRYKKQQIEQKLHQKLAEYNELVLPIALQQMQHEQQDTIEQAN